MDRNQLIQDLLNERSFSTEKSPITNYFVDLRRGFDVHGLPVSLVAEMTSMGARLEGTTDADVQREVEAFADCILEEYGE